MNYIFCKNAKKEFNFKGERSSPFDPSFYTGEELKWDILIH